MAEALVSKRFFEEIPVNCAFAVKVVVPKGQVPTTANPDFSKPQRAHPQGTGRTQRVKYLLLKEL